MKQMFDNIRDLQREKSPGENVFITEFKSQKLEINFLQMRLKINPVSGGNIWLKASIIQ